MYKKGMIMVKRGHLILTSQGLTSKIGFRLIMGELKKDEALADKKIYLFYEPYFSIGPLLIRSCLKAGFRKENIFLSDSDVSNSMIENIMDYIYCTEGNTFEVLQCMQEKNVLEPIRIAVLDNGATYIGSSAGAIIAGQDILLAADFDRNFVGLENLEGLKLFDGTILSHYTLKERKCYIANSDSSVIARYRNLYSVANGRKIIL